MVSDAKYFMMRGWARFLGSSSTQDLMKSIEKHRPGGNWGIGVDKDYWALQWQRLRFRQQRAQRAIGQDKIRTYNFTGDGPLTMKLFGTGISGWQTDPEEKAVEADTARMQEKRMVAFEACKLLKAMEGPYDVRHKIGELEAHEAEAEAMGYRI